MDLRRHSRRSKSFPSTTTISDDPSATTAIISPPLHYLSIPFSWEKFPGIPKNYHHKDDDSSLNLLPLPPSSHHSPKIKKYSGGRSFRNDPFLAAFVECSKDKDVMDGGSDMSKRPTSDRSGFVVSMYSSCKRSCAVSESIVYRPRSSTGYILATDEDMSVAKTKT